MPRATILVRFSLLVVAAWAAAAAAQCIDYTDYLHEAASLYHEGHARAIGVDGTRCITLTDTGLLRVVGIADPELPQELATLALDGSLQAFDLLGDLAVVAAGAGGVHVVDLADPSAPVLLGTATAGFFAFDVVAENGHAYVAAGSDDLVVLEIAPDGPPQAAGQFATPGFPVVVAASGDHVYLGDGYAGVRVYDTAATPDAPDLVNVVSTASNVALLDAAGDRLAAWLGGAGLVAYSLADPAAPIRTNAPIHVAPHVRGLHVGVSSLYLAAGGVVLAYDPTPPVPLRFEYPLVDDVFAVAEAEDGRLAVAAEGRTVLLDAGNHELVGPTDGLPDLAAGDMTVAGAFAYVTARDSLVVVDASDPADLQVHGVLALAEDAERVTVIGSTAVVNRDYWGLLCVDVSDPANPVARGVLDGLTSIDDLVAVNGRVAVLSYEGLSLLDVADPDAPLLVSTTDVHGSCLASQDDLLCVAGANLLSVFDVSDPAFPVLLGTLEYAGSTYEVGLNGSWLYLTAWDLLHVVDLADPTAPVIHATLPVHGWGLAYAFDGSYVYGSHEGAGDIHVFDVSDPGTPRLVAQASVGAGARAMHRLGDHVLAVGYGGFYSLARHCDDPLTSVVADRPSPVAGRLLASPNPCNPRTTFGFELHAAAAVNLRVYDLAGRRVRTIAAGAPLAAGRHGMIWDGRDDAGRSVPSGVYLGRLTAGPLRATARVVVVR
jgi:hypothetical protein